MISPEDESLLSAYIDGELDPLERRAVESALAADPHLSATLRDLSTVRDLVSELSRPSPPDVSSVVVQRILGGLARPRPWKGVRRNLPWFATALATAAAVVLVIIVVYFPSRRSAPGPRSQDRMAARNGPAADLEPDALPTAPRSDLASSSQKPRNSEEARETAHEIALQAADQRETLDRTHLRSLIDDPRLQRVFLVTDQIGGPAEEQVASLVERTTRHNYFKITISQGIVIDRRHPERAVVFAVVLDETELTPFRSALKEQFKDRLHDQEVDPAVALQLADIGQVVSLPAHPVAKVIIPRENIALMADGPTLAQERSAPVPNLPESPPSEIQIPDPAHPPAPDSGHAARTLPFQGGVAAPRVPGSGDPPGPKAPHPAGKTPLHNLMPHDGMRADDHHLVVLVWVTGTNSG
jgi:Putative zinc-finger